MPLVRLSTHESRIRATISAICVDDTNEMLASVLDGLRAIMHVAGASNRAWRLSPLIRGLTTTMVSMDPESTGLLDPSPGNLLPHSTARFIQSAADASGLQLGVSRPHALAGGAIGSSIASVITS